MQDNQQPSSNFKPLKEDSDYLIYDDGRLYSRKTNRFLSGKIDNVGYKTYALAISDKISTSGRRLSKMCYAHRLVADYFLDNPNNLPYVHHKDENKLNNQVSNLEWVTAKENTQKHLASKSATKRQKPRYYKNDLPGEKWLVIPDHPTYSISSFGRVRNNSTNRLLHLDETQTYTRISFKVAGKTVYYYVHRLVYCVFNNDYDLEGYVIDHIDADVRNNSLANLQKITQQENCLKQRRFNDQVT